MTRASFSPYSFFNFSAVIVFPDPLPPDMPITNGVCLVEGFMLIPLLKY